MTVTVSPLAQQDADAAETRLEREHPGYGAAFTDELANAIAAIRSLPRLPPLTEDGPDGVETREYYIARFEYRVIYAFPDPNTAEVIAVIHARRQPGAWTRRLTDLN